MTLEIQDDFEYDEQIVNDADDDDVTTLSSGMQAVLSALGSLPYATFSGFPQYAERDDMIAGVASGATLSLVADTSGTAFSTSVGIATGFTDIDGDAISLYQADAVDRRRACAWNF